MIYRCSTRCSTRGFPLQRSTQRRRGRRALAAPRRPNEAHGGATKDAEVDAFENLDGWPQRCTRWIFGAKCIVYH